MSLGPRLRVDSLSLDFLPLVDLFHAAPGFVWLDSSDETSSFSHVSIVVWEPPLTLSLEDGVVYRSSFYEKTVLSTDIFETLALHLKEIPSLESADLPFVGGFVGGIAYSTARHFPDFSALAAFKGCEAWFGLYDRGFVFNHHSNQLYFFSSDVAGRDVISFDQVMIPDPALASFSCTIPQSSCDFKAYLKRFSEVKNYISAGDIYQANISIPFYGVFQGDPFWYYLALRAASPAPFSGFLSSPYFTLCSSSPECFLSIDGLNVKTWPIKGTISREASFEADLAQKERLYVSEKDSAELTMILDLERHDLSLVCEPGSIEVPILKQVETFAYLHHLVGCVSGTLKQDVSPVFCLKALFPGGSIVGAPKIRAAEIIQEQEVTSRGFYTGSMGFFGCNGRHSFNLLIRSVVFSDQAFSYHVGSGIVSDSDPSSEWAEIQVKAKGMAKALSAFILP